MRNHGNYIVSLSQLGRFLAGEAEAAGASILPETPATKLLVADGRVRGVRTADRGRGRNGEELGELRAGLRSARARHRPGRGHAGPPDRCGDRALRPPGREPAGLGARRQGGLEGREAARPHRPHDGLAASLGQEVPRVRRLVHLPDGRGPGHARDGRRSRLPRHPAFRPRPAPAAEDAPEDPQDRRGRRAAGVGGEDDPGGRLPLAAEAPARAGPAPVRRRGRDGQRSCAEGDPLRARVGAARGRGRVRRAPEGRVRRPPRRPPELRRLGPGELHLDRPEEGAQRPARVHARASGSAARSRAARSPRSASCRPRTRCSSATPSRS